MKITVNNQEIELKRSFRALLIYENITDKAFAPTNISDILTYFYCVILASKTEIDLSFDEFIEMLDEKPELLEEFQKFILKGEEINKATTSKKKASPKKEK